MSLFLETKNLIITTPQAEDFDNLYAMPMVPVTRF